MKTIPVGIEDFKEIKDRECYYVDKSMLIKDVLQEKVVLYTRPRRFGKTLNMSMLNYFYNIKEKENAYLFDGLAISKDKEVMQHQNRYPVIFLSLKDMKRQTFDLQVEKFQSLISDVVGQYLELLDSDQLTEKEKSMLKQYELEEANFSKIQDSLMNISICLEKHYGQKVVILIDEYDVPLQHAYLQGYYDEMVNFLRNVFSAALKTNSALRQGILTGCLRIAKESIFTGMNNFRVNSIFSNVSSDKFGFTPKEVEEMLSYYELTSYKDEIEKWYDGYLFGKQEIYNPWSTNMYVDGRIKEETEIGISYWANTSGNDIIMKYIQEGDRQMKEEFDVLVNRGSIIKKIKPELTYREMDETDNIYSFLLFTGYLKIGKEVGKKEYELMIPNEEVREVYTNQFEEAFREYTKTRKGKLMRSLQEGEEVEVNNILNDILERSISYYDNKESFYHGFLVGLFQGYEVESNKESGDGRFDIIIYPPTIRETVIIIECKHAESLATLIQDSKEGAKQIKEKRYEEGVIKKGYLTCIGYGISFYKKQCYVEKSE